jgi:hypothetical protein
LSEKKEGAFCILIAKAGSFLPPFANCKPCPRDRVKKKIKLIKF